MTHAASHVQGALAALARLPADTDNAQATRTVVEWRLHQALAALGYPVPAPAPARGRDRRGVAAGVPA